MDQPLLESVPNISVGRDVATVDAIVAATRAGAGSGGVADGSRADVVDVHRDSDHDRSVLTILGSGDALYETLRTLATECVERLDLHAGHGVHPRIGVLDVVPIVPLSDDAVSQRAAHDLVARFGSYLGALELPVIRYGRDASGERIAGAGHTGEVRRGGPATVAERLLTGDLQLVAGPSAPHPTAGATICGVRDVLIACNVTLDVDDLDTARAIAARIRATAGGADALPGVRALGLRLASRAIAQVSTNIERHRVVGPAKVVQAVDRCARELGVGVTSAELVGLAPESAVAPLHYACTAAGIELACAPDPSLDHAVQRVTNALRAQDNA